MAKNGDYFDFDRDNAYDFNENDNIKNPDDEPNFYENKKSGFEEYNGDSSEFSLNSFSDNHSSANKQDTNIFEEEGNLDDSLLTDDFVIGQDFFIDSTEADGIADQEYHTNEVKHKKKRIRTTAGTGCLIAVIWMAVIMVIAITAASLIIHFGMDYLGICLSKDPDTAEDNIMIVIEEGTTAKDIAGMLKKSNVIDSPAFFRFYAKKNGSAAKFHQGIFYFSKQDSYEDITDKLTKKGVQAESVKITIPEGWGIDKIAERLEANKVCKASQFKEAVNEATYEKYNFEFLKGIKTETDGAHYRLEGYLYPDTYYFYQTNDKNGAEQVIKKMLENFNNKFTPGLIAKAEDMGYSIHEVVTLASVVEMEAGSASYENKQKVASVFLNRLRDWDNPKLESDPTTHYKYNKTRYNTYDIIGLPPGAYCSPSINSIKAVLYPYEENKYYFFVTDKEGKFYYNSTNAKHSETVRRLKSQGLWIESKLG